MSSDLDSEIILVKSEYDHAYLESQKYYDLIFRTINIYIAFFTTVTVFALDGNKVDEYAKQLIFLIIIPVITYIFGLFYCYYIFAVAKVAYFMTNCEIRIQNLGYAHYGHTVYEGWELFALKNRKGSKIPYTIMIAFQAMVSIGSSFMGGINGHIIIFQSQVGVTALVIILILFLVAYVLGITRFIDDIESVNKQSKSIAEEQDKRHLEIPLNQKIINSGIKTGQNA